MSRIPQQQLESYLWGAAVLLRGTIDAGDYKQFIFPLLFYKRLCDVFDEETEVALVESDGDLEFATYPENHRFQMPHNAHWMCTRQTTNNVGMAIQSAMRAIETANPETLYGIFGDAQWTNKDRLSDAMLRDLIEHFSTLDLSLANLPEDELGQGYEYLIKKFANDSGHTAAEFYTNRTVVHLMTEMLEPQPGESIYDPTCGSGGMLLSAITHLRRRSQEWRTVRLYGQERNLMTSSIARMNCFLHGIEDFQIIRGDTLSDPKFVEGDRLKQFDLVLANPPYSIKQWDRQAFASDAWGRNLYGTPPQGRADYAFWQHILCSLAPKTGRCAILFPHGVLFRQEESEMRQKLIEADLIECVLGLGPNLFYNASMEACVVTCRTSKPKARRGKILFINAVNEVTRERSQSFLTDDHIDRIASAYRAFKNEIGFSRVETIDQVRSQAYSLAMPLYVQSSSATCERQATGTYGLKQAFDAWLSSRTQTQLELKRILPRLRLPVEEPLEIAGKAADLLRNRSGWTRVRFGDVVKMSKETVDPASGEVERYIAGDHMISEDIHLRRWGTVGDGYLGPAFIRRFRKGQVLYGSRRTYLKKVAYAQFDGVTANTTFVLEAKPGKLHQPLLPWFMLSRRFTDHSVRESKGSTNPYINYPDIAKFEFDLPPLDHQRWMAEILWTIDEIKKTSAGAAIDAHAIEEAMLDHFLYHQTSWPTAECRELVSESPRNGFSPRAIESGAGIPTLSISAIRGGEVVPEGSLKYADVNPEHVEQFRLRKDDILVVRGNGNRLLCGRAGLVREFPEGTFYPDLLIRLRFKSDVFIPEFAVMQWNERKTHLRLLKKAKSTNGIYKVNGQDIQLHRLFAPPISAQEQFLKDLRSSRDVVDALDYSTTHAEKLQRCLVQDLLG